MQFLRCISIARNGEYLVSAERTRENRRRHERIAEISHKEHNKVGAILQLLKNEKFALFNSCVSSTTRGVELEVGGSGKNYFFLAFHKSADNMFLSPIYSAQISYRRCAI